MKKVYYETEKPSACADVIPYWENGKFYLFFLHTLRDEKLGEGCPWNLLTTENLLDFKEYGPVLLRGTVDEQDIYVFTGSVCKIDGLYYIYYTGHNPHFLDQGKAVQAVLRATSTDLIHWKKDRDFYFEAPDFLEKHDFRDPFVYFDDNSGKYRMLLAARTKEEMPGNSKGVTMVAESDDGRDWTLREEPFYAPKSFYTHECPDLFKMGEYWYLIFSEFTDKIVTTYRYSKSPNGPWKSPKVNTFDGHAYYAAKSYADDNGRRILFGWNPTKLGEKDNGCWEWGGTIVPHEIRQNPDGSLYVVCPEEIQNAFKMPVFFGEKRRFGMVSCENDTYTLGDIGTSVQTFSKIPSNCAVRMKMKYYGEGGDFGVLLHADENTDSFYKIKLDPAHSRMAMDRSPRFDGVQHFLADSERYVEIQNGKEMELLIIMQDTVLEVYLDGKVAMSHRMYDIPAGQFGIYVQDCKVDFGEIRVLE